MRILQSLGIVFSTIILILLVVATLYLSYIVVIGIITAALIYVVYQLLSILQAPTLK
jgi:hypothetical protein